jgi:hypothetical protein
MEWDDQLRLSEFVCSCFAMPASRADLESAAAVDLLVASEGIRFVSAPGNAIGHGFWALNFRKSVQVRANGWGNTLAPLACN